MLFWKKTHKSWSCKSILLTTRGINFFWKLSILQKNIRCVISDCMTVTLVKYGPLANCKALPSKRVSIKPNKYNRILEFYRVTVVFHDWMQWWHYIIHIPVFHVWVIGGGIWVIGARLTLVRFIAPRRIHQ